MISLDKQYWVDIKSLLVWPVITKDAQQDWDIWSSHCEVPNDFKKLSHSKTPFDLRVNLTVPYFDHNGKTVEEAKFFANTKDQSFIFCKKDQSKFESITVIRHQTDNAKMKVVCIQLENSFGNYFECSEPKGTYSNIEKSCIHYGTNPNELTGVMLGIKLIQDNESLLEKVRRIELQKISAKKALDTSNAKKAVAQKINELGFDTYLSACQVLTVKVTHKLKSNTLSVRYDDSCNNGYNSLGITFSTRGMSGCANVEHIHTLKSLLNEKESIISVKMKNVNGLKDLEFDIDTLTELLTVIEKLIPFHLISTKGPMHYINNVMYHKESNNLKACQSCAIWPELTSLDDVTYENLVNRIPSVMTEFRHLMNQLEMFVY